MTKSIIKPTVGRRVWFRPSATFLANNPTLTQFNPEQPMDAGIVYVHHDHMVNLIVTDHVGMTFQAPSVPLLAGQYEPAEDGDVYSCCEWMPYQKAQAAKADSVGQAKENAQHVYPSHRERLGLELAQGAAMHLAQNPSQADDISNGITTLLDKLYPCADVAIHAYADSVQQSINQSVKAVKDAQVIGQFSVGAVNVLSKNRPATSEAPRVTPADVEENIYSEHYFTAADGVLGAYRAGGDVHSFGGTPSQATHQALGLLTFCVLVLKNGTKIVGINYGAIDPSQHSAKRGREEARAHAIEQIWPLLGFRLRDKLAGT